MPCRLESLIWSHNSSQVYVRRSKHHCLLVGRQRLSLRRPVLLQPAVCRSPLTLCFLAPFGDRFGNVQPSIPCCQESFYGTSQWANQEDEKLKRYRVVDRDTLLRLMRFPLQVRICFGKFWIMYWRMPEVSGTGVFGC